jgi:hypothetical protein
MNQKTQAMAAVSGSSASPVNAFVPHLFHDASCFTRLGLVLELSAAIFPLTLFDATNHPWMDDDTLFFPLHVLPLDDFM